MPPKNQCELQQQRRLAKLRKLAARYAKNVDTYCGEFRHAIVDNLVDAMLPVLLRIGRADLKAAKAEAKAQERRQVMAKKEKKLRGGGTPKPHTKEYWLHIEYRHPKGISQELDNQIAQFVGVSSYDTGISLGDGKVGARELDFPVGLSQLKAVELKKLVDVAKFRGVFKVRVDYY